MDKRFSSVKTDDKVFDLNFGEGVVASLSRDSNNPIIVEFMNGLVELYTYDGKINESQVVASLFWERPIIIGGDKPKDNSI